MTSTSGPDGFTFAGGVWGTDIVDDLTVYQSGDRSIKFLDTTPAADLEMFTEYCAIAPGELIEISAVVRADEVTSGDNFMFIAALWYQADLTYIGYSNILSGYAYVAAANTWETKTGIVQAPASTAWVRGYFSKNNTAFIAWVDRLEGKLMPVAFSAHLGAAGQAITNIGEVVIFDVEDYDYGSWYDNTTGLVTVPTDGIYIFTAGGKIEDLDTDERFYMSIATTAIDLAWSPTLHARTDNQEILNNVTTGPVWLTAGTGVKVWAFHSHASDLNLLGHATYRLTHFAGVRVQ